MALTPIGGRDLFDNDNLVLRDVAFEKGQTVIDVRNTALKVFVVESGWLYSFSFLPNGRRQIYNVYQAGDLIGFEDLARIRNAYNVATVTPVKLRSLDPVRLREYLSRNVRTASYLYALSSMQQNVIMDRMCTIARQGPEPRLAHFLLEVINRTRVTLKHDGDTFTLPLSQELLADCVGMHTVHVSRTFTSLMKKGLILKPSRTLVRILDEQELIRLSNFQNRFERRALVDL